MKIVIQPAGCVISFFVFALCMALGAPVWWSLAIGLGWWFVAVALVHVLFLWPLELLDKILVKTGYYRWATRRRIRRRREKAARRATALERRR